MQMESPRTSPEAAAKVDKLLSGFLTQSADFCFAVMDTDGVVLGWRGAAEKVFGVPEEQIVGRKIDAIFTDEDCQRGIPALERAVAAADARSEDDRWHRRGDGTLLWASGAMLPIREEGEILGFVKVMRDRTNVRTQIETLQKRAESAERQVAERDAFLARLTHEMRNALNPMRLATEAMLRSDRQEVKLPLDVLSRQIQVAKRVLGDLEDTIRIGTGKLSLAVSRFDLCADLSALVQSLASRAEDAQQQLAFFGPHGGVQVRADRERVHQIAFNLVDNALKYTPENGHVWVKLTVEQDMAVFRVEDDGAGIATELLPVVFELFTQGERVKSKGGLGVGLSLVKELVAAHRGTIEVRSDGEGTGAEFAVRLPLRGPDG